MIWQNETIRESAIGLPEAALIEQSQSGNMEAFNQLVITYQDRIFSLSLRILGDDESAEDLTQETFIAAYRSLSRFRGGSFRAWLYRIAKNACYDEIRKRDRHPMLSIEEREDEDEYELPKLHNDPQISRILPEQAYEKQELEQAIQQALNRLDVDQRAVVVLVDLQGMDYQGAAQILGVPLGTVKSRLARARVQLRYLLRTYPKIRTGG